MTRIHFFVLTSDDKTLNQKTRNSLTLLSNWPIDITWVENISTLENFQNKADHCMIIPAGDHITQSYLDAFFLLPAHFHYAYQPQFSYLFAKRGQIFYRRNIDICPITEEINTLLLAPHHSRHIIFPTHLLNPILSSRPQSNQNLFWHIVQYLVTQQISLITLADCISIEYQVIPTLTNKENIIERLYPQASLSFDKDSLLSNQNFSDLYGSSK